MNWTETDPGYWRANGQNASYTIHDGSQRTDYPLNKFVICKDSNNDDNKSGYLNKNREIRNGSAMFCACGASQDMLFDTIEDAKTFAELDNAIGVKHEGQGFIGDLS